MLKLTPSSAGGDTYRLDAHFFLYGSLSFVAKKEPLLMNNESDAWRLIEVTAPMFSMYNALSSPTKKWPYSMNMDLLPIDKSTRSTIWRQTCVLLQLQLSLPCNQSYFNIMIELPHMDACHSVIEECSHLANGRTTKCG